MDKEVNRTRVAKCRENKFRRGYKSLTVYLPPEILKMINKLLRILPMGTHRADLIAMALKDLFKKHS